MKRTELLDHLKRLRACPEAVAWVKATPGSPTRLWSLCKHPDWMLWLAECGGVTDQRALRLAACACARTALKYVPKGEERPRIAIETAERYANGEATAKEMTTAQNAADAAAAYADAAAYAAAYAAAVGASRVKAMAAMAPLVRKHIKWSMVEKALGVPT